MIELYILRHGSAERGPVDTARRLSTGGIAEVTAVRAYLPSRVEWIASSPFPRAIETADLVAAVLPSAMRSVWPELVPGGDPAAVLERAVKVADAPGLLVSHLPLVGRLLQHLTGREVDFAPAALVRVVGETLTPGFCDLSESPDCHRNGDEP